MSLLSHKTYPNRLFHRFLLALFGLALLFIPACTEEQSPVHIDLSKRVSNEKLLNKAKEEQFTFGIGSMITPKEGYAYYRRLIQYLGENMGQAVRIVDRGTYEEMNNLLEHQQLDAAFVCGGPYVEGKESFNLELLALPEMAHGPIYFSYLIVPANSTSRSLEDLRGKKFAFTDPKSNSGMIVPSYWLAALGETPDSFFSKHIFTYAHDASIKAVIDNLVDGAAVDSLIWDFMNGRNPEIGVKTRIIKRSQSFGIPPLVVRPGLPTKKKQQLREILLGMHQDPAGKQILAAMDIKRFIIGEDSAYDSIRNMRQFIKQQDESN